VLAIVFKEDEAAEDLKLKGGVIGVSNYYETASGGRSAFRTPDTQMEP
jgi:hypothetical protein